MSTLRTLCRSCAAALGIYETLLPLLSVRPCEGCGTSVGYEASRDERGFPLWGRLVAPYTHIWQWWAWPISWGLSLQDTYGTHAHEWSTTHANYQTGDRRESCRCREQRSFTVKPTVDLQREDK